MKKTIQVLFLLFLVSGACLFASAQPTEPGVENGRGHLGREIRTVTKKWFATQKADGKWQVAGEALFKNRGWRSKTIREISLTLFAVGAVTTRTYRADELPNMLMVTARTESGAFILKPPGTTVVERGDEAVALVTNDELLDARPLFAWIRIRFTNRRDANLFTSISEFNQKARFEMPFGRDADRYWYAANTAGTYGHWPTPFPQPRSNVFFSQRYAVDFVQVNIDGQTSSPAGSPNKEDYFAWGKDAKAAEEGEVVAIVNELPDVEIGQVDINNPAGNYVVIRHAPRLYTIYGHLMQGSVVVSVGQKVDKGQVIGKIGNSGNSDEPHIHFHAMDRWDNVHPVISGFTSQGVPALFWNTTVLRNNEVYPMNGNSLGEGDVVLE